MPCRFALIAASLVLLSQSSQSAEIKVLSANGMREVMHELRPAFERTTGHRLTVTFATVGVIVTRVEGGETADVIVAPRQGIDRLVRDGKVNPENVNLVARSGIGVIVRSGTTKPDISTPEALKRTLIAAKSITYLDPAAGGTTGTHVANVLERLGIAKNMKAKTVFHPNAAAAGALVANGEAEIGINLVQELMPLSGIEIVGPLPGDLQLTLTFVGTSIEGSSEKAASQALIQFLRTPVAAEVIKAKGMEPAF